MLDTKTLPNDVTSRLVAAHAWIYDTGPNRARTVVRPRRTGG